MFRDGMYTHHIMVFPHILLFLPRAFQKKLFSIFILYIILYVTRITVPCTMYVYKTYQIKAKNVPHIFHFPIAYTFIHTQTERKEQ